MRSRGSRLRRGGAGLASLVLVAVTGGAAGAGPVTPRPGPPTTPGGLTPPAARQLQARAAAGGFGDCGVRGVTCKPSGTAKPSCTGYTSQTTAPANIRVLVRTSSTAVAIRTIPFTTYVENVLPNEWVSGWDGDALKAGAVAVKSYAWYWVTHFGGYLNNNQSNCFDVTDDTNFQVYKANSAQPRTNTAVTQSWPVALRVGGRIVQASYRAYLHDANEACGAHANGNELSQWGTQNCNQASSGNKYNVILGKYYYPGVQLATARQQRAQHDFQFLQRSTPVVVQSGKWTIDDGYPTRTSFGYSTDVPTITTNGDGFARIGVFRPSTAIWYVASPSGGVASKTHYGGADAIPVQAQYLGVDKPTVIAMFRPSTATWYRNIPADAGADKVVYGQNGDIPVPGHYFGTAANHYADEIAVFRPSSGRWYVQGHPSVQFGQRGDIPVPADYDGDGTTDIAVYRPSDNRFYVRGRSSVHYGGAGDVPVTGDFTGDGKADFVIYHPATRTWYVWGGSTFAFGAAGDTPIGTGPYHD